MQEFRRRADDAGAESANTVLARIDERLKGLSTKLESHLIKFDAHEENDDNNFRGLYRIQWIGYGILIAFNFLILFFKH